MKQFSRTVLIIGMSVLMSTVAWTQEFRNTTAVQSANQSFTVDLSGIADVNGAAISIRNSPSASTVSLPYVFTPANQPALNGASILARLNSLPTPATDQDRVIEAWQFVASSTQHFCYAGNAHGVTYDPVIILNAYGFGCCEQRAYALAWIWQQQGYQTRLASLSGFHTIPEAFYGNAWHMLDPDHDVYYLKDDQTIASVQDILNDPTLVSRTVDANGNDPAGWSGAEMAALYEETASTLRYWPPLSPSTSSTFSLRPGESMNLGSLNRHDSVQFYPSGQYLSPNTVNSIQFSWNLSFADAAWKQRASTSSGVDVTATASGIKILTNTSSQPGYVVYSESSLFPVLSLAILAQLAPESAGSLQAYYSVDGTHWSNPVPFQPTISYSSFDLIADLSSLATGTSTYYVKVELDGAVQLHRLRISPLAQASRSFFPKLQAGNQNALVYQDLSPATQARAVQVTTTVPTGQPLIRGVHAESLIPESPTSSLSRDYAAGNLVDGDPNSLAYPGSMQLDYVVQLNGSYNVTGASIDWGYFGSNALYVQSWQILGRSGTQDWQQLASGGFPGQSTMDVPLNVRATELRLVASGSNWIGAYELRVFGTAAASTLALAGVQSNVPENPVYSIARNYGASNLIDGDPKTLAYPGSNNLDYQISLGGSTHLSSASITWGYFGTNPAYVSSWSLLGRNGTGQWTTLAQGAFPNSSVTQLTLDFFATDVRILASSTANWIGIYDLSLTGGQPLSGFAVQSNAGDTMNCASARPSSNIADGDETTFAYPCNLSFDYTLDPGSSAFIDTVNIVWGYFGSDPRYIQTWRLMGLALNGRTWEVVASGMQPGAGETLIPVQNRYRKLRIAAEGINWIGVYEVQVFGIILPLGPGQVTVKSNVPEDPVYSIARGYQASNLIDGDPSTLAYPGSKNLDYQVSFGQPTQLSSAFIKWGQYGTNPIYVNSWSLLARGGANQPWVAVAQGGFPNSSTMLFNLDFAATDVRLVASSTNWIGVYELTLNGVPLQ